MAVLKVTTFGVIATLGSFSELAVLQSFAPAVHLFKKTCVEVSTKPLTWTNSHLSEIHKLLE